MVKVCPAIVAVPVRAAAMFDWTVSRTSPLPEPVAPSLTVIHGTSGTAVHEQPGGAVTPTATDPPVPVDRPFLR